MLALTDAKKAGTLDFSGLAGLIRNTAEQLLVPWARLELARLSTLPPQDSVSTNFTTKASLHDPAP